MHSFFCKTTCFLFQLLTCHHFYFCLAEHMIHNRVYRGTQSAGQTLYYYFFFIAFIWPYMHLKLPDVVQQGNFFLTRDLILLFLSGV